MQDYELMVILSPLLTEEACAQLQTKYTNLIKENGGLVEYTNFWGLKTLAFPIQKKTSGFYWVVEYKAPSDTNEKLKTQFLRDDSVIRHLITKLDKHAVAYNLKKRKIAS